MTSKGKEVKLNAGYGGAPKAGKEYSLDEIYGLRQVFLRLEQSNPKRSGKIDYWLSKNADILGAAWNQFKDAERSVYQETVEIFTHPSKKDENGNPIQLFYVTDDGSSGKTFLYDEAFFYELTTDEKGEPVLTPLNKQTWTLTVPSDKEDVPATTQEVPYNYKFKSDEHRKQYEDGLKATQETYKATAELWKLPEDNLEGLQVMWVKTNQQGQVVEDLSVFRSLLYDNAISK